MLLSQTFLISSCRQIYPAGTLLPAESRRPPIVGIYLQFAGDRSIESRFKNDKGNIFGGYASIDWTSSNSWKSASDSFIFTLTNIHETEPTKFPNSNSSYSIDDEYNYGPRFGGGCDISIYKNGSYSNFPHSYQDILGKGKSIFTGDLNNNNQNFNLKEIEVFKIFK